jgi:hypothetical protein
MHSSRGSGCACVCRPCITNAHPTTTIAATPDVRNARLFISLSLLVIGFRSFEVKRWAAKVEWPRTYCRPPSPSVLPAVNTNADQIPVQLMVIGTYRDRFERRGGRGTPTLTGRGGRGSMPHQSRSSCWHQRIVRPLEVSASSPTRYYFHVAQIQYGAQGAGALRLRVGLARAPEARIARQPYLFGTAVRAVSPVVRRPAHRRNDGRELHTRVGRAVCIELHRVEKHHAPLAARAAVRARGPKEAGFATQITAARQTDGGPGECLAGPYSFEVLELSERR